MLRVLVLGSTGMAGHVMTLYLMNNPQLDVSNLSHRYRLNGSSVIMDVTDFAALGNFLDACHFDIIINCIGILNQFAEENKDRVILLNGYLPHFLESKYRSRPVRVIQISTDCVFSGKTGNYCETAFRDGDSFYARTKTIGELANDKDLTIRTSIIGPDLSPDGIGLFNWFLKTDGEIKGYANAIWSGITTLELAKAVEAAIFTPLTGIYHLAPDTSISKYELLSLLKNKFDKKDVTIRKYEDYYCNKSLVDTRRDFGYSIPSYPEMIDEMKCWIDKHNELYPHYKEYKL